MTPTVTETRQHRNDGFEENKFNLKIVFGGFLLGKFQFRRGLEAKIEEMKPGK